MLSPTRPHPEVDLLQSPARDGKRTRGPGPAPMHEALQRARLGAGLQIRRDSIRGVCKAWPGGAGAETGVGRDRRGFDRIASNLPLAVPAAPNVPRLAL